jgi:hypothetical protein
MRAPVYTVRLERALPLRVQKRAREIRPSVTVHQVSIGKKKPMHVFNAGTRRLQLAAVNRKPETSILAAANQKQANAAA